MAQQVLSLKRWTSRSTANPNPDRRAGMISLLVVAVPLIGAILLYFWAHRLNDNDLIAAIRAFNVLHQPRAMENALRH